MSKIGSKIEIQINEREETQEEWNYLYSLKQVICICLHSLV